MAGKYLSDLLLFRSRTSGGAFQLLSEKEPEERANAFFTGQIIEDARKRANITQEELAQRIGSNKSYISRVEKGRTEPKVSTFYRIIAALGLTVELTPVSS